jgi:PAS domain-containing protein
LRPDPGRDNQVVGAVLVFRNVTDEYAAQQALRDSAALIQTILNTVVDGVITCRPRRHRRDRQSGRRADVRLQRRGACRS